MTTFYRGDPYWTRARFRSTCRGCGRTIEKGEEIFYYPKGREVYCDARACGKGASADFLAAAEDEDVYNGRY